MYFFLLIIYLTLINYLTECKWFFPIGPNKRPCKESQTPPPPRPTTHSARSQKNTSLLSTPADVGCVQPLVHCLSKQTPTDGVKAQCQGRKKPTRSFSSIHNKYLSHYFNFPFSVCCLALNYINMVVFESDYSETTGGGRRLHLADTHSRYQFQDAIYLLHCVPSLKPHQPL